jgi:hypothetical protein
MSDSSLNDLVNFGKSYQSTPLHQIFSGDVVMVLYPRLAAMVGNSGLDAVLISQINHWVQFWPAWVVKKDGQKWLNMSAQEMWDHGYIYMTPQGINKAIKRLTELGFLILSGPSRKGQRKHIRVNYDLIREKYGELFGKKRVETRQPEQVEPVKQDVENEPSITRNSVSSLSDADYISNKRSIDSEDLREGNEAETRNADANSSPEKEMTDALLDVCQLEPQIASAVLKARQTAKMLVRAGYTAADIRGAFLVWWRTKDWRGRKGDIPSLREIELAIRQALGSKKTTQIERENLLSGPVAGEAKALKRQANPVCHHCEGQGWRLTYDPRMPWEVCDCVPAEKPVRVSILAVGQGAQPAV